MLAVIQDWLDDYPAWNTKAGALHRLTLDRRRTMRWQSEEPTTISINRCASNSEGRPFEAVITLKFTVLCPVCQTTQVQEQAGYMQSAQDDWAAAGGRYYWCLPGMIEFWEERRRGLGQEACCECGTIGILPTANLDALYGYVTELGTDEMIQEALGTLGFEVDRVNRRFCYVGVIPAENEVVLSN
jgi:hypothetical protein